ncbi:RNA polymerase sigma factor [Nocardioides kribbensis]|uniref:RNA polymerase sigma factor n=1 Tax=Nocardioides kribbensis TaxID=305517 RepID=UPI00187A9DB6|nr:sigma-70 family RNA polymerase sigma factor [Nocardioides kribbensis]
MTTPTDDLVRRARTGDAEAWRALYRAHAGRLVVWLGTRPTGDAAVSADDVAAEAWLVAARRIAEFDGDDEEFAGWLFGIARRVGLNLHRRSARRGTTPTEAPPETSHHEGPEESRVAIDWARQVLQRLPPRERDVVACTEVVGLDVATTAQALGISAVAVRVARHRGLRRLRDQSDLAGVRPRP